MGVGSGGQDVRAGGRPRARRSRHGWMAVALASLAAGGCGGGSGNNSDADLPRFSGAELIEAAVDESGAALVLGEDLRVSIPKGALKEPVDVRVTRVAAGELEAAEPSEPRLSDLIKLEPHGLKFERPIDIELRVMADDVPDARLGVRRLDNEQDREWETVADTRVLQPADASDLEGLSQEERSLRSARRIRARSMQFSIYTAVEQPADGEDAGTGDGTLRSLPIDFRADCPAVGCTVEFEPTSFEGVWVECDTTVDPAELDPETFDFAQACAEPFRSPGFERVLRGGERFELYTQDVDILCERYDAAQGPSGELLDVGCVEGKGGVLGIPYATVTRDNVLYTYEIDDCDGTCSGIVVLRMLEARDDLGSLETTCDEAAEQFDFRCGLPGTVLPFGPAGVGDLPSALADTLWANCGSSPSTPPDDSEFQSLCAAVTDWESFGGEFTRFTARGTLDELQFTPGTGWSGRCGTLVGGTDSSLRRFTCPDAAGRLEVSAIEEDYELRTVGSLDYLVAQEVTGRETTIFVALDDPTGADDPCADAPPPSCVLE